MLPAIVVLLAVMSLAFFSDSQMASASPSVYSPSYLNGIAITNTAVCDQQYPYECGTWLTPWSWLLATGGNRMRDYGWNATYATYIPGYTDGMLIEVNYTVLSLSPEPHGHFGNSTVHLAYDVGAWKVDGPARLLTLNETATITTTTGSRADKNILFTGSTGLDSVSIRINSITINGVPAYTIYPPTATPAPQGAMPCITVTATLSPTAGPTQTPAFAATQTPGGPTASPTPTRDYAPPTGPTATPQPTPTSPDPGYDTGVMAFTSGLEKLSAVGRVNSGNDSDFLQWDAALGQDSEPGVALLHAGMDDVMTATTDLALVAMFKWDSYKVPVGLTWWARTAYTLTQEETHSMRVWYLDPDYDGAGHQVWVAASPSPPDKYLSNSWRKFGIVISPTVGSGKVTAVGFSDSYLSYHYERTAPCPSNDGCIYLDDVRLTFGMANGLNLPACEGSEGGGGGGTHVCIITQHTIDVLGKYCAQPTSFLDIGGYISWLGCTLKIYFTILPENSAQINAVTNYANGIEPFGTIRETSDGMGYVQTNLSEYSARYNLYRRSTSDWGKFFNWYSVMHLSIPNPPAPGSAPDFMSNCQFASLNPDISSEILNSACFVESFATNSGLLAPLQILIDLFCVVALFMYIRGNWMAGGGGGGDE